MAKKFVYNPITGKPDLVEVGDGHTVSNDDTLGKLIVTIGSDQYAVAREKIEKPATPTLTAGGTFTRSKTVNISCATSGVTIRYTINGEDPTATTGTVGTSLTLSQDTSAQTKTYIVKAVAVKNGMVSDVATATYNISRQAETPTVTASDDDYSSSRVITLACTTPDAVIHYTTDGSTPTASSAIYDPANKPIIHSTSTVKAIAVLSEWENSSVATATYTVGKITMRYGYAGSTINAAGIASLSGYKKAESSPAGTYTATTATAAYLWICIDPAQSFSSVKSGGFDVPLDAAQTIGSHKCYRSSVEHVAGTITFVIA